jgi:hypothetical protein
MQSYGGTLTQTLHAGAAKGTTALGSGTERTARLGYLRYPLVSLVEEALASRCTGTIVAHQTRVLRTGVCPAPVPPERGLS